VSDYADWTESIELLGSEIMVPTDCQGATIMVPFDIQGATIMMPMDIQGQTVDLKVNIVAQTIGNIGIDIKAQTVGNISVNIAASAVTLNVNIAASAVTMNVNIAASAVTLNVNIAASAVTMNVNIAASAVTMNVNISASAVTINMDIKAQSVAVKYQAEWSVQQGQQKFFRAFGLNKAAGGGALADYTVTTGKILYITHFSGSIHGSSSADGDKDQICHISIGNLTADVTFAEIGGHGGGGMVLQTPVKVPAGQVFRCLIYNMSNHTCNVYMTAGGYEL